VNSPIRRVLLIGAGLLTIGAIGILFYFGWIAYFQRFPNADWWTFFF